MVHGVKRLEIAAVFILNLMAMVTLKTRTILELSIYNLQGRIGLFRIEIVKKTATLVIHTSQHLSGTVMADNSLILELRTLAPMNIFNGSF